MPRRPDKPGGTTNVPKPSKPAEEDGTDGRKHQQSRQELNTITSIPAVTGSSYKQKENHDTHTAPPYYRPNETGRKKD